MGLYVVTGWRSKHPEGVQETERNAVMHNTPRVRRMAGCFVGVCDLIVGIDKIGGNRTAVESFVVALGAAFRVEKGKARTSAGRRRHSSR